MTATTWLPDPSHYPEQMTPLSATVWFTAVGHGMHEAMRDLQGPFAGFDARTELGWAYEGELPLEWEPDPARLTAAALDVARTWDADIAPRVHAITDELRRMRPESPAPPEAAVMFDRMWQLVLQQWTLHFLAVVPAQFAIEELHDRYVERFGDADTLAPYRLLEGARNESMAADEELRQLARQARQLRVDDVVRAFPPAVAPERLQLTADGRTFLRGLDDYLSRFGGRSRWHELSLPREVEAPQLTFESLRLFLDTDQTAPPRERGGGRPPQASAPAPELETVLEAARAGYGIKESHVYHIDYPGLLATREVLLGFGRRLLAEGRLDEPERLWLLRRDELRALVADPGLDAPVELLDARREELARGLAEGPRAYLGEPLAEQEQHAVLAKFYGSSGAAVGRRLLGTAASRGTARGPARIVLSADDFGRVSAGDVLVAVTTTPAWTPLFPALAGLVTETGGILSHAAIVAREYGLPAVVGAPEATRRIPDGAPVEVDGTAGSIELLSED